jgi:L-ascorbate metabolism protein UlaG (beta-lactamase superfamily)
MSGHTYEQPLYMKPSVKLELLACRWYAWCHLISPVQHALNLAFRQLPILRSFMKNPSAHEAAAKDPNLLCGPFVHLPKERAGEVSALLEETRTEASRLITFAEDLRKLDCKLQKEAKGFSLDAFYAGLPQSLAGTLELTYDGSNHPGVRVFEELVVDGQLDNSHTQEVSLYEGRDRDRPFFLNTPRLRSADRIDLRVPFDDERIDVLSALRTEAGSLREVAAAFDLDAAQTTKVAQLLSPDAPQRDAPNFAGPGVRIRYFGHACVLLQSASGAVLFDPLVAWDSDEPGASLTFQDLPDTIDQVVLTHNHQDHVCPEILVQLRKRIKNVCVPRNNPGSFADPSMRIMLERLGLTNVRVADPMTRIPISGGAITSVPFLGEHADLDVRSKHGALLEVEGRRFLFLVDSDCVDANLYEQIKSRIGDVDALFIGMECHGAPLSWLYGPYLSTQAAHTDDDSRRLSGSNCDRAWKVVEALGCQRVFVYAMGQEPWLMHLMGLAYRPDSIQIVESNRLIARCREHGIPAERLKGACEIFF